MSTKKILIVLTVILALSGIYAAMIPIHANTPPPWTVSLDANSTAATDANPQTTNTVTKTFRIGAVVNASGVAGTCGALCINNVFGWQFGIVYDNTTVLPQADPSATSSYPDGADNTVAFGGQAVAGNPNWALLVSNHVAFGGSSIVDPRIDNHHSEVVVFLTILSGTPAQHISPAICGTPTACAAATAVKGNLLASVAFELLAKPANPISFSIQNVTLVDPSAVAIPNITLGSAVTVTVTNAPPTAAFTTSSLPSGDATCTPITGSPCSAFAVRLDGSTSSDPEDGVLTTAASFIWDFGDATQDIGVQGSAAVHDYLTSGTFHATLRVQDSLGATGSARDGLGNPIVNVQQSHTSHTIALLSPTSTAVVCSPASVGIGVPSTCTATVTDNSLTPTPPSGDVKFTSSGSGSILTSPCTLANPTADSASCSVTYTPSSVGTGTHTITAAYQGDTTHDVSSKTFDISIVSPFDFSLSAASPNALTVVQGNTSPSSSITATLSSGTAASLTFMTSSLPSGVTAAFTNNPCTPTCTVQVSFSATNSAATGTTIVTVTATGGGATHTTTISLTVSPQPFDFSLSSPSPGSLSVVQGASSSTSSIIATLVSGTAVPVTFTASGLPTGVIASFVNNGCTPTCTVTVSFAATSTATIGPATIMIDASGGGASHSTTLSLTVNAPAFDFSLSSPSPGTVTVVQGTTSSSSSITATLVQGNPASVTFSASGLPTGVTANFNGSPCSPTCSVTVTFTATNSATIGTSTITITASGGGASHTTSLSLTVNQPPFDFSLSTPSPNSLTLVQGSTSPSSSITATLVSGSAFVGFTTSSLPSGVTAQFTNSPCSPSCTVTVVFIASSTATTGTTTVTITATGGGASHSTTLSLTVNAALVPDFSIAAGAVTPSQILAAASGSSTITLTPVNGYTGTIHFTTSASTPSGLTCTVPPDTTIAASPQTVTLTCSATSASDYTITLTGTDTVTSSLTHTTSSILFHVVDFTIQPSSPITISGVSASTITQTITLTALNGFTGTVNLLPSASTPSGLTCTLASSVTFGTSPKTASLSCTATVTSDTDFSVTVTGTSDTLSHTTAAITFHVTALPQPDFAISAGPVSPTQILLGGSGSSTITVTALNGYTGTVNFNAAPQSQGLTCTNPAPITFGSSPQTVTLTCLSTQAGDDQVRFEARDSVNTALVHITGIPYHVVDFAISPGAPVTVTGTSGSPITQTITIDTLNGLTGTITLSSSASTPAGLTCTIAPSLTFGATPQTATLSCTAIVTSATDFTETVTGTIGTLSHTTADITFHVNPPAVFDYSLSTSPSSGTVTQGGASTTTTVTATLASGASEDVALTVTGLPDGVSATFSPTHCTPTCTPTLTLSANLTATTGTVTLTITGTSATSIVRTTTYILTVNARVNVPPVAQFTESLTTAPNGTSISFNASSSTDNDGFITSYTWDFGDGNTATGATTTHTYSAPGSYTVTLTVTDNDGASSQSTSTKVITAPSANRILLTFNAFDADQYVNGQGELDVKVNGQLVINVPGGLFHLTGSGSYEPFNERWVFLGPFDITGFVVPGLNTITFTNPLTDHASLVRNVTITSNAGTLLSFHGTASITPYRGLRLLFASTPLVFTSLTVSPSIVVVDHEVTFTASFTGGAGPFSCTFRFGDDDSLRVTTQNQSCSATHTYDDTDTFNVRVTVRDAAGNTVTGRLTIEVHNDDEPDATPILASVDKPVGKPGD